MKQHVVERGLSKAQVYAAHELVFGEHIPDLTWTYYQSAMLEPQTDSLLEDWKASLPDGDMSLYDDPRYLRELFVSYLFASRESIRVTCRWWEVTNEPWRDFTVFEDFNGVGLTTLDLMSRGLKSITVRGANDTQWDACNSILGREGYLANRVKEIPVGHKFDAVFSLEIIEHFRDFDEYMHSITDLVKPGGYLILAKCFSKSAMYTGHFNDYRDGDRVLTISQSIKKLNHHLSHSGFELLHRGYNSKPLIYRLLTD